MGAMCVQKFDDSQFCNSQYLSRFAAFFIDARTKRSVVESFNDCIVTRTTLTFRVCEVSGGHAPAGAGGRAGPSGPPKQRE